MNRKEFIKKMAIMGAGIPIMPSLLQSCYADLNATIGSDFKGKVLIIGAGAAGMAAGYILKNNNIEFEILEASSVYGGRIRRNTKFADFPIDIGAEWIHTDPSVLAEIAGNPAVNQEIETFEYKPEVSYLINGKLKPDYSGYQENKFKRTTWFGFFENYIVPDIYDNIRFASPVKEIDYSSDRVVLKTRNGTAFVGDKVLVTTSIRILQGDQIQFVPPLPQGKKAALRKITMVDGIKVFMEFHHQFYPDMIIVGKSSEVFSVGYKIFYDAAYNKDSNKHILGLFAVDKRAQAYINLSEEEVVRLVLQELDELFAGQASKSYKNHIVQNWTKEPFIQGAYTLHFDGFPNSIKDKMAKPIDDKVYFAGEALSKNNQAQVHGACEVAFEQVTQMLKG